MRVVTRLERIRPGGLRDAPPDTPNSSELARIGGKKVAQSAPFRPPGGES